MLLGFFRNATNIVLLEKKDVSLFTIPKLSSYKYEVGSYLKL